ncbi:LacI family DNA-binding transcriptional regulator [Cellulomonas sp. ATA003]|uniref:LacI family DNA-binding transcriptional regulator n=1 Tax=Cellulomonas sp. ATA003 TaxID=3073064 RepID=UPI002873B0D1|nr:LacI family DNA-binding transcriptional regulator [Cellulomonas sp. ATA003]WNB85981.1 LacI family DNA-binding transcriptional regulator [Cellulomonas sp. ATA003]
MTRPTLADVAAEAGVSVSTASLAFSGAGPIAAATRDRVLAAAARLSYAGPNPLGQQLRSGRSGIVGVVVGDRLRRSFRDPVSTQMLDGLAHALSEQSLGLLLIPSEAGEVPPLVQNAAMDAAVVVLANGPDDGVVLALTRRGIPVVSIEGEIGDDPGRPGAATANIGIDDRGGTTRMVRELLALGHRRFGVVALPYGHDRRLGAPEADGPTRAGYAHTRRRLAGIADAGVVPEVVIETPASLVEHGRSAGHQILRRADPPTAVVALSDLLASGVVLAARELGLRVPEDVSVSGFDGIELPWLAPDVLTSVHQPLADKGRLAGEAAVELAAGRPVAEVVLPVDLQVGTTTGPPPDR